MDVAETPPVFPCGFAASGGEVGGQGWIFGQEMRFEQLQNSRYGGQYRDAFAMDGRDQARRLQLRFKVDLGGEQRRHPETHELAEDVAEWKAMQEAQRMHPALVLEVFLHLALDRAETGEYVPVGVDDAFGSEVVPEVKMIWSGLCSVTAAIDGEEWFGGQR